MEYGQVLDCLIREVFIEDPSLVPVHVLKADFSNRFYRIRLRPKDDLNLLFIFPSDGIGEYLVTILITLPMGWKNSTPILCTSMDAVADLDNVDLCCNQLSHKHKLDVHAESLVILYVLPLQASLAGLSRDPYLSQTNANPTA